ncbi:MAG: DUF1517 domain-containing protein [Sandaracinaceae bacterium]
MRRWQWLVLGVGLLFASPVFAQSTGGSFGGGSFGGGSFGGSSSSSSSGFGGSSSYSGSSSSSSWSSSPSSGGGGGAGLGAVLWVGAGLLVLFIAAAHSANAGSASPLPTRRWNRVDITSVRIALDWRARASLQRDLNALARRGNTGTNEGLSSMLREVVRLLEGVEVSWLYAGVKNFAPMNAASAEGIFRRLAMDARARFSEELVRNADGQTTTREARERSAHAHEGEGVVVVTLVVASNKEILDVVEPTDAAEIKILLEDIALSGGPLSLVAMEVVWSPAQEEDRMSTAELEQHYPEMVRLSEDSMIGRAFCDFCSGPYPRELGACPHCGAPVSDATS